MFGIGLGRWASKHCQSNCMPDESTSQLLTDGLNPGRKKESMQQQLAVGDTQCFARVMCEDSMHTTWHLLCVSVNCQNNFLGRYLQLGQYAMQSE
jgi:hypothetical protein